MTSMSTEHWYAVNCKPRQEAVAEENLLRYNGMIIGVFELLADARDQINTVMAAINAEQQF